MAADFSEFFLLLPPYLEMDDASVPAINVDDTAVFLLDSTCIPLT